MFDHWQVEYNSGIPVYRQIINQACAAVAVGTLKPGAGTLEVTGNANLCNILPAPQQQCFILDLALGDTASSEADVSCVCVTPSVTPIDIASFLTP